MTVKESTINNLKKNLDIQYGSKFSAIDYQDYSGFLLIMGAMLAIGVPGLCLLTVEAILLNYE